MLQSRTILRFVALLLGLCAFAQSATARDAKGKDPKADDIAALVMEALGGEEAWQATRFLRFTFADFRTHHWDKYTGRHRLEFTDREGHHLVVLHNVLDHQGRAWRDGTALAGDELDLVLEAARAAWINDTYWLLMPYKLRDPGVTLTYDGQETIAGVTYDKLHLSFAGVGLTPGDQYWAYINPQTHLMDRWAYFLQSFDEGQEPTVWDWTGWRRYGEIRLASGRKNPTSGRELPLANIAVLESIPDSVFESPEATVKQEASHE